MKTNFIDLLKGLCIIAIVLLHIPRTGFGFPILQILQLSVPGFILIASVNNFNSLERNSSIKDFYLRRAKRLLPLFFFAFLFSFVVGLIFGLPMNFGLRQLVGYFPLEGPGNYFLPLLFQLVVFFPLLYLFYKRAGFVLTLVSFWFVSFVYAMGIYYGLLGFTAQFNLIPWLMLVFCGMVSANWSIWKKNYSLPFINFLGRKSYPIFLFQIIFFRIFGGF